MNLKLFIILIILFISGCTNSINDNLYTITGRTMGTTYSIKFTSNSPISVNSLQNEIDSLLKEVNRQMSTFIPSSELSKFNSAKDTIWHPVSFDLAFVVKEALKVCKLSDGNFDITIGPIVNLWGFGPKNRPQKIPTDDEIKLAKQSVGFKHLKVNLNPPEIKKQNPNIYCDLSAIAKGFGVDKVSEFLLKHNLENHLVEIGGELKSHGKKFGSNWIVGISVPNKSLTIQERIYLDNLGMATSGDYWNYFEENGIRFSHTINPNTGKPITHNLASVTVITPSCMLADAYATAIDVMGPIKGMAFAQKNELNVYLIVKEENDFQISSTEGFKSFIIKGN